MAITEENMRLVPLSCPTCGRHVASSGSCTLVIETPSGSLMAHTGYARFLCACGALLETRQVRRTGRLFLVELAPPPPPNRYATSRGRGR